MDQLQQDASESYELLLPHRKRRDSLMAGSESSGSEESPLLDEKLGRLVEEDDVASWRSPVRSTKMWAAKLNEWGRMGTTTLVDKIVAAVSATPAEGSGDHQDALEMQQGSGKVEYLMLCIACEKGLSRLVQVKFSQPPASDVAFFRLLASEYFKIWRRYFGINPFWNKVVKIHFVRFQTLPPYKLQQIIEVRDMDNRPDQGCTGWTRTEGASCPPTPNGMAIYLKHPESAGETQELHLFPQVPRKLDTNILMRPGEIGWGLYFEEETRWFWIRRTQASSCQACRFSSVWCGRCFFCPSTSRAKLEYMEDRRIHSGMVRRWT